MSHYYLQPNGRRLVTLAADDNGSWVVFAGAEWQPCRRLICSSPDVPPGPYRRTIIVPHFEDARPLAKLWAVTCLNGGPEECQPGPVKFDLPAVPDRPGSSTQNNPKTPPLPRPTSTARRLTQLTLPLE